MITDTFMLASLYKQNLCFNLTELNCSKSLVQF